MLIVGFINYMFSIVLSDKITWPFQSYGQLKHCTVIKLSDFKVGKDHKYETQWLWIQQITGFQSYGHFIFIPLSKTVGKFWNAAVSSLLTLQRICQNWL